MMTIFFQRRFLLEMDNTSCTEKVDNDQILTDYVSKAWNDFILPDLGEDMKEDHEFIITFINEFGRKIENLYLDHLMIKGVEIPDDMFSNEDNINDTRNWTWENGEPIILCKQCEAPTDNGHELCLECWKRSK